MRSRDLHVCSFAMKLMRGSAIWLYTSVWDQKRLMGHQNTFDQLTKLRNPERNFPALGSAVVRADKTNAEAVQSLQFIDLKGSCCTSRKNSSLRG